jgi:hypothetical protein
MDEDILTYLGILTGLAACVAASAWLDGRISRRTDDKAEQMPSAYWDQWAEGAQWALPVDMEIDQAGGPTKAPANVAESPRSGT